MEAYNSGNAFRLPDWSSYDDCWYIKVDDEHFKSVKTNELYLLRQHSGYNLWTDWETNYKEVFNDKLEEILE